MSMGSLWCLFAAVLPHRQLRDRIIRDAPPPLHDPVRAVPGVCWRKKTGRERKRDGCAFYKLTLFAWARPVCRWLNSEPTVAAARRACHGSSPNGLPLFGDSRSDSGFFDVRGWLGFLSFRHPALSVLTIGVAALSRRGRAAARRGKSSASPTSGLASGYACTAGIC
jgi:hypothetical protein